MSILLPHTSVSVIESRWWQASHESVRPLFELLSELHTGSSNKFDYEMCNSKAGFREAIERQLGNPECSYLSLNTHGNKQGLQLFNEEGVSRTVLRNAFHRESEQRNTAGLHLGCCSFLSSVLAEFMYQADISPWWIAGYGEKINWVESTSLDFMFFNKLLETKGNCSPV